MKKNTSKSKVAKVAAKVTKTTKATKTVVAAKPVKVAKRAVKLPAAVAAEPMHKVRVRTGKTVAAPKAKKVASPFSKSRDTREDRGSRQMKNSKSAQTFPHGR